MPSADNRISELSGDRIGQANETCGEDHENVGTTFLKNKARAAYIPVGIKVYFAARFWSVKNKSPN